ncbi:hypothetical protein Glove_313g41 [Diversispora epigaea]|uniref:BTB domain-containing protein n=1 Tax=Diversispora epigaea TaxID=1348612 RepID=A0A397HVL3_9GLOM|nr:hypothetical protein Glove_313g41 [Diversispora epigaea]
MATKFFDRLSRDLTQLLEDPTDYNVTIEIGEAPNSQIFTVHSYILQSRSPYFKNKFNETPFNDDHIKVLTMPNINISIKIFDVIIKYIYGGIISLEKLENSTIFDLVIASNELELNELVEHLQTYLINNCASWLRLKFARIYRTSYQDGLQLVESKIWEYVIKWGKAKNSTLPTNLDKWTSDNFLTLKETLKRCLPHIRYFSFSNEDVAEKIFPYHRILEPKLWLDINSKIMTPNKQISSIILPPRKILKIKLPIRNTPIPLPSNIITNEHALEISSWIDKKESPYIENYPYDFKLLVRGSRDGFDVKTIYNICDKVANTIIILKVNGTGEILGGYNPLEWEYINIRRKKTADSFIFSLKTANLKNSILSRVKKFDYAIYNYPDLSFNDALRLIGNLKTEKRCYCMANSVYSKPIRSVEFISQYVFPSEIPKEVLFSVEEYEIFKILPKNDLK